jgi:hypothetical protein
MRAIYVLAFMLGLAASMSCARHAVTRPGTTTTTSVNLVPDDTALPRIASARCRRELGCARIGADQPFATYEDCKRELGADTRAAFGDDCARGMRDSALSICVSDIGSERCGTTIDSPVQIASCRKAALCR